MKETWIRLGVVEKAGEGGWVLVGGPAEGPGARGLEGGSIGRKCGDPWCSAGRFPPHDDRDSGCEEELS